MAELLVLRAGARSTVQDLGFVRARGQGVPPGGAMDRRALLLLNGLLGDPPGTAAIEVALTSPVLRAEGGPVRMALSGGLSAVIRRPDGTQRPLAPWTATTLQPGEELHPGAPDRGGLGLIGIGGGPDLPRIMGSRSTSLKARFGGIAGRALQPGDRLRCPKAAPGLPDLHLTPPPAARGPIRAVPGPQTEWFTPEALAQFFATDWTVTPQTDRMGMRLAGPQIAFAPGRGPDIVSDGAVPGAIQVPGNGQPIILLADAQTTGGYAKIATVIGADLPRLAALIPGDTLRLTPVTVPEAEAAARAEAQAIAAAIAAIAPVIRRDPTTADLMNQNLAGAAVDAAAPDHFPGHLP